MPDVFLSQDTSSRSIGAREVEIALRTELVRRGGSRLVLTGSRGAFFLEPLVEVEIGGVRVGYANVRSEDVAGLLDNGMLEGRPIEPFYIGAVAEAPFLRGQERITFRNCGVIEAGSLTAYLDAGGGVALRRALFEFDALKIIAEVKHSGLRGRGGAAFPTGAKWQTVADCVADEKYVVANGDEGDPGTYADRMLMEGDPFALLEGMAICARAVGAHKGFIYVRAEYPRARTMLQKAVEIAHGAGFLGADILGSGFAFDVEIRSGGGAYVCGEETALLESLEGKRGMVRPKPPYPATVGLFGRPTVINNVTTFATIPPILRQGGEWYAAMGTGRSRGTVALQLAGSLRTPGLVEVPFGVTLRDVINTYGGGVPVGRQLLAVQVGGPLGDLLPESGLDLPIDFDAFTDIGSMLGHGGIVVYDDHTDPLQLTHRLMAYVAHESCGKCAPCRLGSQRAAEILESIRKGEGQPGDLQILDDIAFAMRGSSLCALGAMAPTPVLSAIRLFPDSFGVGALRHFAG
ncbi:MAG: formate dehydrogenase [Chloroflexi bacterium]|nr:formate dehydrogenase [Chloroflexota bacterium]MCL5273978.1 formate dehydrogenase [Chloroflexota bacterium]